MMNREQLEELRRRVEEDLKRAEEDYGLDIAAIERLQRRYSDPSGPISSDAPSNSVSLRGFSSPKTWSERESSIEPPSAVLPPSAPPERKDHDNDMELENSLRKMFSAVRK